MKKLIWLIVFLMLFAGCSKNADSIDTASPTDTDHPKSYMTEPKIFIAEGHRYKEESWLGEQLDFQGDSISLQGDSFFVDLIFHGSFEEEKLKDAVKVEGFKGTLVVSVNKLEGKTVLNISCREVEYDKGYKLIVSKDVEDIDGNTLKADIQKEIIMEPDTVALYTFYGAEGVQKNLGIHTLMDAYAVGGMNLSPASKTIAIDFSSAVDKQSVEQSILEGLKDKGIKCGFKWNSEKSAVLELSGFPSGEDQDYAIKLDKAKDIRGKAIYGDFYFVVGKANWLGAINISSKSDQVLKKFEDKRYMAVQSPSIDKDIIIDGIEAKRVFHIPAQSISELQADRAYTLGIPGLSFIYSWKDSENLILLNSINGSVICYSTGKGVYEELFTIPDEILKGRIMDISVSPDGNKLAVAYESEGSHVHVFDMQGKLLYEGSGLFKAKTIDVFGPMADVQWYDNDTLVLEDNKSTEAKLDYNIISINIKTDRKDIIAEHAYKPVVLAGKGLIKVERFSDFASTNGKVEILRAGKAIRSFVTKLNEYDNFFFADENIMIYNKGDEIVAYYMNTGKSETIGSGYIIGLSKDKSKVYYMANHKMLYYIP